MSKITGKTKGDFRKLTFIANKSKDGSFGQADFEIGMSKDEVAAMFSEELADLAFSSMREVVVAHDDGDSTEFVHYQDTIKPGDKIVFEQHAMKISGMKVDGQPDLLKFTTVQGVERVVAHVRIEIPSDGQLASTLPAKTNSILALQFNPSQGDLPGTG